jgi:hypothetical protein
MFSRIARWIVKSAYDALPPELAKLVSPRWRKNELEYWQTRDQLVDQYWNKWIGFADGAVIACGTSPVTVFHAAEDTGLHPFVTCVGREDEPDLIRRAVFPYDASYTGEPLPRLSMEVRTSSGSTGHLLHEVIADTGADSTVLPWGDTLKLQLDPDAGRPGWMGGVGGARMPTLRYQVWIALDGQVHPCRVLIDLSGGERILGRDVLNRVAVLFDGPAGEVVVNP